VLWSPARMSDRFPDFEAASHFAIHILAHDQQDLSIRFASSGDDFAGLVFSPGIGDAPLIPGCAVCLECRHAARYDGGDHLIVVGEVLRITEREAKPLLFHRGAYRELAHH